MRDLKAFHLMELEERKNTWKIEADESQRLFLNEKSKRIAKHKQELLEAKKYHTRETKERIKSSEEELATLQSRFQDSLEKERKRREV